MPGIIRQSILVKNSQLISIIPIVEAKELRIDNLFESEDGSVAILDYESSFKESNFTKYGRYILNVIDHYLGEGSGQTST